MVDVIAGQSAENHQRLLSTQPTNKLIDSVTHFLCRTENSANQRNGGLPIQAISSLCQLQSRNHGYSSRPSSTVSHRFHCAPDARLSSYLHTDCHLQQVYWQECRIQRHTQGYSARITLTWRWLNNGYPTHRLPDRASLVNGVWIADEQHGYGSRQLFTAVPPDTGLRPTLACVMTAMLGRYVEFVSIAQQNSRVREPTEFKVGSTSRPTLGSISPTQQAMPIMWLIGGMKCMHFLASLLCPRRGKTNERISWCFSFASSGKKTKHCRL